MAISFNERVIELHDTDSSVIDLNSECGKNHTLNVANKLLRGAVSTCQDVNFSDSTRSCSNDSSSRHTRDAGKSPFNCVNLRPGHACRTQFPIHSRVAHHHLIFVRIPVAKIQERLVQK